MNWVQRKRLKRFANYLINKVNPKHFDIGTVCSSLLDEPDINYCGTTACAIGHLPLYNSKRFKWVRRNSGFLWSHNVKDMVTGYTDYIDIAINYFGLSDEDAIRIFIYGGIRFNRSEIKFEDITPAMVGEGLLELL